MTRKKAFLTEKFINKVLSFHPEIDLRQKQFFLNIIYIGVMMHYLQEKSNYNCFFEKALQIDILTSSKNMWCLDDK